MTEDKDEQQFDNLVAPFREIMNEMSPYPRATFAHLPNVGLASVGAPYDIIPGCHLVQPEERFREPLRRALAGGDPDHPDPLIRASGGALHLYEHSRDEETGVLTHLPASEWRYWGIRYDNPGIDPTEMLDDAGLLMPTFTFEIGARVTRFEGKASGHITVGPKRDLPSRCLHEIRKPDLEMLAAIHARLLKHDNAIFDMKHLIRELRDLRAMDWKSKLRFLGYVAVLESLLTHVPDPKDPYESIRKQIRNKMTLLSNRTGFYQEWAAHFPKLASAVRTRKGKKGTTGLDSLWFKIYDYRSAVAHGGADPTPDPELESHKNVLAFVIKAVTMVMRYALEEPVLIRDLKLC